MSSVTYFQRYSQKENVATNNTLLLLRYFHERAPGILQQALSTILNDEPLHVGLQFTQQVRGSDSIPDGSINQQAISIHIETKVSGHLDTEQLKRHIASIKSKSLKGAQIWLLGLNVPDNDPVSAEFSKALSEDSSLYAGVRFAYVSFKQLHNILENLCPDYDIEAQAILTDFLDYLEASHLVPRTGSIKVFPTGGSLKVNVAHKLYFEPAQWQRATSYDFIGLYSQKCVRYIGRCNKNVVAWRDASGAVAFEAEPAKNEAEAIRTRISAAMEAADKVYPGMSCEPHRYYLLPDLCETRLRKISKGGIMGPRVFFLSDRIPEWSDDLTTFQIAEMLEEQTFE